MIHATRTCYRIEGLDALRGIAALIVVFGHAATLTGTASLSIRLHLAVDLFFMLSGYVMARSYEKKLDGDMAPTEFLRARLLRVWPIMAVGTLLGFLLMLWLRMPISNALVFFVSGLLFIPLFSGNHNVFPVNPPIWSILFELGANIIHATVLRKLGLHVLAVIALGSAALLVLLQTSPNPGSTADGFLLGLPRAIYGYVVGIMLWRMLRDRAIGPAWPAVLLLPSFVAVAQNRPEALWLDWLFMFVVAPLCIIFGLGAPPFRTVLLSIGSLSFPLYAVHGPVLLFAAHQGYGILAGMAAALAAATIVMWLAAVSHVPKASVAMWPRCPPEAHRQTTKTP